MRTLRAVAPLALLLAAPLATAAPTTPLQPGIDTQVSITGGAINTQFFVDVGANDRQLQVTLNATNPNQDVDLLLRYGTPFPETSVDGLPTTVDYLYETAQYHSFSAEGTESITIGRSNVFPVRAGRWYVAVVNFETVAAAATLRANVSASDPGDLPITVVFDDTSDGCDVSGWNDATARAPVGGNTGTTLGQQRRNAMLEAARLLGAQLKSPVPIRVHACWRSDLGTGNSVTLAQAGAGDYVRSIKFLPRNHTWYPITTATRLGGARYCGLVGGPCDAYEVFADFNIHVDTPQALGSSSFYYGLAIGGPPTDSDFITTAMHEITHGLGFLSLVNDDPGNGAIGREFVGYDDVFEAHVVHVRSATDVARFSLGTNADRAAALTSISGLRWDEPEAVLSSANRFAGMAFPDNLPRLYAPNPTEPGSTLSHLDDAHTGEMMRAFLGDPARTIGLAQPMLHAAGWSPAAATPPPDALPRSTQYFDPAHPGHGIDFQRVADNVYFMTFYTYGANGEPEWYVAIGPVIDNVFVPADNANGDSLVRYRYVQGANPPQQADASVRGQVRLDFNGAVNAPECNDGTARDRSGPLLRMGWSIGSDTTTRFWCMQPLVPASLNATPDFTGNWYAGASDGGWGFSLLSFRQAPNNGLFGALYYPDAQGNGRWAYVQTSNVQSGVQYDLFERQGYCRTCPVPASALAGQFTDVDAGNITFTLTTPSQSAAAGNRANFSVTYQRAPGGTFPRDSPIILLTTPAQ
jgi:hypothetical protein